MPKKKIVKKTVKKIKKKDPVISSDEEVSDDLTYNGRKNYTLNHFVERVKIYTSEHFPYHIYTIPM